MGLPVRGAGQSQTVGDVIVCVAEATEARITGVSFRHSANLVVRGFSAKVLGPHDHLVGAPRTTLAGAGYPPRPAPVRTPCGDSSRLTDVGVEVALTEGRRATAKTLLVGYSSEGRTGTLEVPMELILCTDGGRSCG